VCMFCSCSVINSTFGFLMAPRDRLALATSLMALAWLPYYMHRPFDYFIFWLLAIFPLSFLMQNAWQSAGARAAVVRTSSILCLSLGMVWDSTILPPHESLQWTTKSGEQLVSWSGLKIPIDVASDLQQRLNELNSVNAPDAVIVTGIPYAVAASGVVTRPPVGAIFYLAQKQAITKFIRKLLREKPNAIVMDPNDTPALGAEAIAAIVARIESNLSSFYTRDATISKWRVWRLNKSVTK
ncbi:MAG: hypothetical protein ABL907_18275, partial [Hyphomicrobium sp.]